MLDSAAMKRRSQSFAAISVQMLLVFLFARSANAQAFTKPPVKPVQVKSAAHRRKATLPELYEMFFTFSNHVETTANAGTERGQDLSFYRFHLQRASGLDEVEYAHVLDSAQKFAAVNADVMKQIGKEAKALKEVGTGSTRQSQIAEYRVKLTSLMEQKSTSLRSEIANVRQALGDERANIFESYLQTKYLMGRIGPDPPASNRPMPKHGKYGTAPANLDPGQQCQDFYFDDGDGEMEICADAQISYLGSPAANSVEFYAAMDGGGCISLTYTDPSGLTAKASVSVAVITPILWSLDGLMPTP
jgi:hypothetical protein